MIRRQALMTIVTRILMLPLMILERVVVAVVGASGERWGAGQGSWRGVNSGQQQHDDDDGQWRRILLQGKPDGDRDDDEACSS